MTAHATISYIKSAFRIFGYLIGAIVVPLLVWCFVILIAAEVIGIVEEFGQ